MQNFAVCNEEITQHIERYFPTSYNGIEDNHVSEAPFTNTYISKKIRDLIPIEELKTFGAFFTGDQLSDKAANLLSSFSEKSRLLDPACGAGSLLISVLKYLPVRRTLSATLNMWGDILYGFDLHEEFIRATKLRIILDAMQRVEIIDVTNISTLESSLPHIQTGNIYDNSHSLNQMTHIFINPPYIKVLAPDSIKWASGHINSAAMFIDYCIDNMQESSQIVGILPEVLRSGSNYEKWRGLIADNSDSIKISHCMQFDKKTGVDIFLFSAFKRTASGELWNTTLMQSHENIGSFFDVSVGPVVPHRDELRGKNYPYIKPHNTPSWETLNSSDITERRQYAGHVVQPPFIVIRRTSSPSDQYRAIGTIITGEEYIAVENHLIIVKPKSKKLKDCQSLLSILKADETNDFLNRRIRCRHLTVSSVKEIPFKVEN